MEHKLNLETFLPYVGDQFRCSWLDEHGEQLILSEAAHLKSKAMQPDTRPPFHLLFLLRHSQMLLGQQITPLQHPALGELEIFLVPVGPAQQGAGWLYQAVFN